MAALRDKAKVAGVPMMFEMSAQPDGAGMVRIIASAMGVTKMVTISPICARDLANVLDEASRLATNAG